MTLVVTGAAGRVGRALRLAWRLMDGPAPDVLWLGRKSGQDIDITWDIDKDLPPLLPAGAVWLHLAGQTQGDASALAENRRMAQAISLAARERAARHVILMSSVAVYRPGPDLLSERDAPNPASPYGSSKLAAERAATQVLAGSSCGLTILRLGNLAGADALLRPRPPGEIITLDPVLGQPHGPERSYIGPMALATVLRQLLDRLETGSALPLCLNIAQPPALAMADLLDARQQTWRFGPANPKVVPRVAVDTTLLASLTTLSPVTPASLIADLDTFAGAWP